MATESFTNSNGVELTTHSANWNLGNALSSDFVIDSNALRTPFSRGITLSEYYSGSFSADQYAQGTITQVGSTAQMMGLAVRGSAGNAYTVRCDAGQWVVEKTVTYALTQLDTGTFTVANGDVLYFDINGTTWTFKLNGATVATGTDASLTSGAPGVCGYGGAASGTYTLLDDWTGADIAVTALQFFQYTWPHQLHARR